MLQIDRPGVRCTELARNADSVRVRAVHIGVDERRAVSDENHRAALERPVVGIEVQRLRARGRRVEEKVTGRIEEPGEVALDVGETGEVRLVRLTEGGRIDVVAVPLEAPLGLVGPRDPAGALGPADVDRPALTMKLGHVLFPLPCGLESLVHQDLEGSSDLVELLACVVDIGHRGVTDTTAIQGGKPARTDI